MGIDIMDLPQTERGNRHVVVMQDLFTKWPMVYPVPDQKNTRIARLIAEELIPMFGVPECLLSNRGTNLLSNLMMDLCQILGITKLNTTAYHPQCDGAVERFNRTLKTALGNMQPPSDVSGTASFLAYFGRTETCLTPQLARSHHFCSMDSTVDCQLMQHSFPQTTCA